MLHQFCREPVVYLSRLYIDAPLDISGGGILRPLRLLGGDVLCCSLCLKSLPLRARQTLGLLLYCGRATRGEADLFLCSFPYDRCDVVAPSQARTLAIEVKILLVGDELVQFQVKLQRLFCGVPRGGKEDL